MKSTFEFKGVLTSLPITQLRNTNSIEADTTENLLQVLSDKYESTTGIKITNEYLLHYIHIDEILKWEETKDAIGPFFSMVLTEGKGDPLKYISTLLVTGRVYKNIVVIEADDKSKLNQIKDSSLKIAIDSETIIID